MFPPILIVGGLAVSLVALARSSGSVAGAPDNAARTTPAGERLIASSEPPRDTGPAPGAAPVEATDHSGQIADVSHDGAGVVVATTSGIGPGEAPSASTVSGDAVTAQGGKPCLDCGGAAVPAVEAIRHVQSPSEATIGPELSEELGKQYPNLTATTAARMLADLGPSLGAMW